MSCSPGAVSWCHRVTSEGTGEEGRALARQAWPPIPTFAFEQDLLEEWKGKGAQVEEIGRRGTLLENLIVEITAPNAPPKAGELWPSLLGTPLLSPLHLLRAYLEQKWGYFPFLTKFRGPVVI